MKILGLHVRNTFNCGDRYSSPLEYFDFPGHEVEIADLYNPPDYKPDVVIYGGGSIVAAPEFKRWKGSLQVAWGVGHHERDKPWEEKMIAAHKEAAKKCDLYFPRDPIKGFPTVPCASCMHPVFDKPVPQKDGIVRYSAARRIRVEGPANTPHMSNEDGSIEEAVDFLASGSRIITSSYHGAYWARLLGKKARVEAWGSKFEYLPRLSLAECRDANRRAYREVLKLIEKYG